MPPPLQGLRSTRVSFSCNSRGVFAASGTHDAIRAFQRLRGSGDGLIEPNKSSDQASEDLPRAHARITRRRRSLSSVDLE